MESGSSTSRPLSSLSFTILVHFLEDGAPPAAERWNNANRGYFLFDKQCPVLWPSKNIKVNVTCHFVVGSVPRVSPPSGTVELNRTSSVNLTCLVSGQAGVHMEWYKNRRHIPALSQIRRIRYANDSVKSVLTLNRVKYKDRGSIISCSAWYPTLSINSTRNILLLVHGRIHALLRHCIFLITVSSVPHFIVESVALRIDQLF